jgi:hypothetical protein
MLRPLSVAILCTCLFGCTSLKVAPVDQKTGHLPANAKASVVASEPVDLDTRKALVLVPNDDFTKGELASIGYFTQIMTHEELETAIIQGGLSEKVPTLQDKIGINNAARYYKPFIWLHYSRHGSGTSRYVQLILTDATTMQNLWVAEMHLDYMWTGVNDQYTWYPLFNGLIDYIQANSKTFRH